MKKLDYSSFKGDNDIAITYEKLQSTSVAKFVNKLMEGCFTQKYMATHTVSGDAPRESKDGAAAAEPVSTKPGMREDHISSLNTNNIVILVTFYCLLLLLGELLVKVTSLQPKKQFEMQ